MQTLEFFDMKFKFEKLLDSLADIFRWVSTMELMLFLVSLGFFSFISYASVSLW